MLVVLCWFQTYQFSFRDKISFCGVCMLNTAWLSFVFLHGLGVMNEAECVYVGDLKKKKDRKIPRWKGSRSKRQTLSTELSQHVPITAALRQSPDGRFFWPIPRAGGDQRKIFEGKRRVVYWEKHTVSGEEKSGQNEGGMVTVTYSIRERLKMRDRGHKQVRRWEHWSMKGYREERQHATVSPC